MGTINTETNQRFLRIISLLQNNKSNAVLAPKKTAKELFNHTVYYDHEERKYTIYPPECEKEKLPKNLGGRPRTLTDSQIAEILCKAYSMSNRAIANEYNVSEGTIRNVLKRAVK